MKIGTIKVLVMLALVLSISGCGGGGAKNYNITRSTTVGQELSDLHKAYLSGAIDEKDYRRQKSKILERDD